MKCVVVWTAVGTGHSVGVNTCLKLAAIGAIQGRRIITPVCDRHETPSVFVLPISLGLDVLSSCFSDSPALCFLPAPPALSYFFWTDRRGALTVRTLTRWQTALSVATCARRHVYVPAHQPRTSRGALAMSIRPQSERRCTANEKAGIIGLGGVPFCLCQ